METLVRVLHVLVGGAFFGACFFSLTVLHRRGPQLFETREAFARFVAGITHGNRQRGLTTLAVTVLTGALLGALMWSEKGSQEAWLALLTAKALVSVGFLGVFAYVSWRLWPARVFAVGDEIAALQRKGNGLRLTMCVLLGLAMVLGVFAARIGSSSLRHHDTLEEPLILAKP
jgi:hypothetical protein